MPSLLEKASILINTNLDGLEARCRDGTCTDAVDEYLRRVHENRQALADAMQRSRGIIATLKQNYDELSDQMLDEELDNMVLLGNAKLPPTIIRPLRTKSDLAKAYYQVWQQQAQLFDQCAQLEPQLTLRFVQAKQIRRRVMAELGARYMPWSPDVQTGQLECECVAWPQPTTAQS